MTAWHITYALIFAGAMLGAANIFCTAPDWMQKVNLGLLMVGFLFLFAYRCAAACGVDPHWEIEDIGMHMIVLAALVYVFRIVFIEHLSCKKLSGQSLHFPG